MATYTQFQRGTLLEKAERLIKLRAIVEEMTAAGEPKRKIGAAKGNVSRAHWSLYEACQAKIAKENPDDGSYGDWIERRDWLQAQADKMQKELMAEAAK